MTEHTTTPCELARPSGDALAEIGNAVVRLYKDLFGRGPAAVRTRMCDDNLITVLLEEVLTPLESRMVELGEDTRVRAGRAICQSAHTAAFREIVERCTGRTVSAFISGIDPHEDVAAINFVLAPPSA